MTKVKIIAEAGVNHNGDIELAKRLIEEAAQAGADMIKFQTFTASKVISRSAPKAKYQKVTTDKEESQLEMAKKLELDSKAHRLLQAHSQKMGLQFLSTPFDLDAVDLLVSLGLKIFKIPSGEITNLPLLKKVGGLRAEIFLSTGMACLGEIESAIEVLIQAGTSKNLITVLHCNTEYPTPMSDVNLLAMQTIQKALQVNIGYSDHTLGIEVPTAAVAIGATVIEKHFTLDRQLPGPDHQGSAEPREFKEMVKAIRNIELALGDGLKRPSPSETPNLEIARKSIVASRRIRKGEILSTENLTTKRPGTGMSPMLWDSVIGTLSSRDFQEDDLIIF